MGPDNRVVINEVLSQTQSPFVDAVELRNATGGVVDVSRWFLSDAGDPANIDSYAQFQIPDGTQLPAGAYLVFDETNFNPNGPWNPGAGTPGAGEFSFEGSRDNDVWLIESDAAGRPSRFVDHLEFGPARVNESWGRWPNGTGALYPMASQTLADENSGAIPRPKLGRANTLPRVGPVVVQEIHHSPAGGNSDLEFIEIRNPTNAAIALDGWRLRGDADFNFPIGTQLAAGGIAVVVPFAPSDTAKAGAFVNAYAIGNSIALMGPWSAAGNLPSLGHSILYRLSPPTAEDPYLSPLTIEDDAHYRNAGAWPDTSGGFSLNRRSPAGVADLAVSWKGEAPSPGDVNVGYPAWKAFYHPLGIQDSADPDGDGAGTLDEYFNGTNPNLWENQAQLSPALSLQIAGSQTSLIFQFAAPLDRNATYSAETSPDFQMWTPVNSTVIGTGLDFETRRVTLPINPASTPRLFLRLRRQVF